MKRALILAAGRGSRVKPLTNHCPKPLLPVFFVPQILYTISLLEQYGINEIGINLFHLPKQIPDFLNSQKQFSVTFKYFLESPEILDSGGGIRNAADWLFEKQDHSLVINADQITNYPLDELLKFHNEHQSPATMGLIQTPGIGLLYNEVKTKNHKLLGIKKVSEPQDEKSSSDPWTFSGIQILSKKAVYRYLPEAHPSSVIETLYGPLFSEQGGFGFKPTNSKELLFLDTGTIEGFYNAYLKIAEIFEENSGDQPNLFLKKVFSKMGWSPVRKGSSWFHPKSRISPNAHLGSDVFVGEGVFLNKGSYENLIVFSEGSLEGDHSGPAKIKAFSERVFKPGR